jgi:hypothetical protein
MTKRPTRSINQFIPGIREAKILATSCEQPSPRPKTISAAGAIAYQLYEMFGEAGRLKGKLTDEPQTIRTASTIAQLSPRPTTNFTNYLRDTLEYNGHDRNYVNWGQAWSVLALRPGREPHGRTLLMYQRELTKPNPDSVVLKRTMLEVSLDARHDSVANLAPTWYFPYAGLGDISQVPDAMEALQLDVDLLGKAALDAASKV